MTKRIPKTLYHYCSIETFYNIITNRSLWLSDISKSNDSQELKWLKDQCELYILKSWLHYVEELDKADRLVTADFEKFKKTQQWSEFINKSEISKCWVFCLSEKKDDLGQWRGYAQNGCGISIGFKSDFFKSVEMIAKIIDENEELYFQKVKYTKKQIEEFFYDHLGLREISINNTSEEVVQKLNDAIFSTLWNSAFFKSETFKEEREWRIAYSMSISELSEGKIPGILDEKNKFKNAVTLGNYGFSTKNNSFVSHVELGIPKIESVIDEIRIGPKSMLSVLDVKLFLVSQGILKNAKDKSIKIYKSNATYR